LPISSKGTSESVVLTWDEAEHAQYYQLLVEGTLLADSIATTFYIDEKGSMTMTKYSLKAYSFCGESEWVSDSGRIGVASELVDNLDNLDCTSISINMEILTNNPAGFGGDGGRIARSAPELAELIYNYAGLTDFSIDLWIVTEQGITSDFKVYTSTDGSTYSEIPTSQVTQNLG